MRPFIQSREAVRVKVKKYDGKSPPDIQKFSVDPQITSLDVLQSILIKAFNLKGNFSLSYKIANDGQCDYVGLLSDWDLDAAFLRAQNVHGAEPCVHLRVDVKSHSDVPNSDEQTNSTKWAQKNTNQGIFKNTSHNSSELKANQFGFQGMFMNQMEKTLNMVSRALNLTEDPDIPMFEPLNDAKFRSFLDPVGQVIDGTGLRQVIYSGGIDPSLRRVVWKHILNVYPEGMSGKQRMDYMKRKSLEYFTLRDVWRDCIHKGQVSSDLMYVTSMVKKDVLRTDRHHKFYAGSDDNQNIASLFNILTTYAVNHPFVSYCQGMSDLASPLLVTMGDEAHAYICFCALMSRLYPNFLLDGEAMTLKFAHLTESLQVYDPQFYTYLKNQQADDLLFCYRWLLLEMKREFAFDDALRMLEVLWSSLPSCPPTEELLLKDKSSCPTQDENEAPISPLVKNLGENAYTKLCAMRRQHSSASLSAVSKTKTYKRMNQSLDENIGKKCQSPLSLQFSKEFQSLDDAAISTSKFSNLSRSNILCKSRSKTTTCSSNSVTSSGEQDFDNYSELADDDSLFPAEESVLHENHSDSKEYLLQSNSLPSSEKSHRDISPIRIIENFNEFKKLSLYGRRNKCVTKANSITELKVLKKQITSNIRSNDVTQDAKQYDNTLKESEYEDSSPDDSKDYSPMTTSITTELKLESENFDKVLCHQCTNKSNIDSYAKITEEDIKCCNLDCNSLVDDKNTDLYQADNSVHLFAESLHNNFNIKTSEKIFLWENPLHEKIQGTDDANIPIATSNSEISSIDRIVNDKSADLSLPTPGTSKIPFSNTLPRESSKSNSRFFSNMSQELENARKNCEIMLNSKKPANLHSIAVTISNFQNKYENHVHSTGNASVSNESVGEHHPDIVSNSVQDTRVSDTSDNKQLTSQLPSPQTFGGGNPFLMFLCLTVLMQHRDHIMTNRMDYNELAMHFDKMVRKHNVNRVLNQARQMYSQYLQHQNVVNLK